MPAQSNRDSRVRQFAREAASNLSVRYPFVFTHTPVAAEVLAKLMGVFVSPCPDLDEPARLERSRSNSVRFVLRLKSSLSASVQRFAVAHELGHVILADTGYEESWSIESQESFANTFARELLIPCQMRTQMQAEFRALRSPVELLRLASRLGVSIGTLLVFATSYRDWFHGVSHIWLRVRFCENAFKGGDRRFRIFSAHYDRETFFVPRNISIKSLCGDDSWLETLAVGDHLRKTGLKVNLLSYNSDTPKWLRTSMPADIYALRVRAPEIEGSRQCLILVEPVPQ